MLTRIVFAAAPTILRFLVSLVLNKVRIFIVKYTARVRLVSLTAPDTRHPGEGPGASFETDLVSEKNETVLKIREIGEIPDIPEIHVLNVFVFTRE